MQVVDQLQGLLDGYVVVKEPLFVQAAVMITMAPVVWNIIARTQYYTNFLVNVFCGNRYMACYALAVYIFSFSLWRDYVVDEAMAVQPTHPALDSDVARGVAGLLFGAGSVFVLSSMWMLGVTGTYLGDYCGILMDSRVTGFPFNVLEHPMYTGSFMCFLGRGLWNQSPAGMLLAVLVYVMYQIAELFEGPFTAKIYADKASKTRAKGKAKKVD